jgi:hypothetical protein
LVKEVIPKEIVIVLTAIERGKGFGNSG